MASFFTLFVNPFGSTATQLAEASDFDRQVIFLAATSDARFAFTEDDVSDLGASVAFGTVPAGGLRFVLPAGEELWAYRSAGVFTAGLVVTKPDSGEG